MGYCVTTIYKWLLRALKGPRKCKYKHKTETNTCNMNKTARRETIWPNNSTPLNGSIHLLLKQKHILPLTVVKEKWNVKTPPVTWQSPNSVFNNIHTNYFYFFLILGCSSLLPNITPYSSFPPNLIMNILKYSCSFRLGRLISSLWHFMLQ